MGFVREEMHLFLGLTYGIREEIYGKEINELVREELHILCLLYISWFNLWKRGRNIWKKLVDL